MTTEAVKTYTIEEFEALPEDGKRYELVKGELVIMAGANEEHCRISGRLHSYLGYYVLQNDLGEVYGSDARYLTIPGDPPTIRQADVSFMQKSRVKKGVFTIPYAADLIVEVISESNSFSEIEQKIREYFQAGSRLVWLIEPHPVSQSVLVYRQNSGLKPQTYIDNEDLDGENIIPGFKIKVSDLFV